MTAVCLTLRIPPEKDADRKPNFFLAGQLSLLSDPAWAQRLRDFDRVNMEPAIMDKVGILPTAVHSSAD